MQYAALMGVLNGSSHLKHEFDNSRSALPRGCRRIAKFLGNPSAVNPLHRKVLPAPIVSHFVNRDNVRVIQAGCGFSFSLKSLHIFSSGKTAGPDHFQRHNAIQADLMRAKHYPHPSLVALVKEFEISKTLLDTFWL